MTYNAEKSVKPSDLVPEGDKPIAIVVGAIAVGSVSMTVRTKAIYNYYYCWFFFMQVKLKDSEGAI